MGVRKCIIMCRYVWRRREYERVRKRARVFEKRDREWWRGRLRLTCLLVKRCRLPHQCLMLVLPGAGNLVQKGERKEEGESREKRQDRWSFFSFFFYFFFMWRHWQLPCIALSLNNGMLICITRDVITSTVKRKHNNSSTAPPWDRLGWPTLELLRDALELCLSQPRHESTHMCAHTHMCMAPWTHSHS